jgi:uncharacterized OB-fold protein
VEDSTKVSRPVADGLFETAGSDSDLPSLIGSRCRKCQEVVFPQMSDCPNCVSHDTMERYRLRGHGHLRDFVVAHRGPTGFAVPYVQAYVKLDDGPVVYANLDGVDPDESRIELGIEVEMRIGVVKTVDGVDFVGWTFHPVERKS